MAKEKEGLNVGSMIGPMMGLIMVLVMVQFVQGAQPACTPGETKCVGYDLYQCDTNHNWVLAMQNSPECGYVPVGLYGCPYCTESFSTLEELIAHIATAHPDKPPLQLIDIIWD